MAAGALEISKVMRVVTIPPVYAMPVKFEARILFRYPPKNVEVRCEKAGLPDRPIPHEFRHKFEPMRRYLDRHINRVMQEALVGRWMIADVLAKLTEGFY